MAKRVVALFVLVVAVAPACSGTSNNVREEGVTAQLIDNQWNAGDTARYFKECADIVYEFQKQSEFTAFSDAMYDGLENICDRQSKHFTDDIEHPLDLYDKECIFDAHLNWMIAGIADSLWPNLEVYDPDAEIDFDLADLDDCSLVLDENYKNNS